MAVGEKRRARFHIGFDESLDGRGGIVLDRSEAGAAGVEVKLPSQIGAVSGANGPEGALGQYPRSVQGGIRKAGLIVQLDEGRLGLRGIQPPWTGRAKSAYRGLRKRDGLSDANPP
jgi:hypothetical protein